MARSFCAQLAKMALMALLITGQPNYQAIAQSGFAPSTRATLDPTVFQAARRDFNKKLDELRAKLLAATTRTKKDEFLVSARNGLDAGFEQYMGDYLFRALSEEYKIRIMSLSANRCVPQDPIPAKADTVGSMSPDDKRAFQFDKQLYEAYCSRLTNGEANAFNDDTENDDDDFELPPSQPRTSQLNFKSYRNYDIQGTVLSQSSSEDVATCEARCRNSKGCSGYTQDLWNKRCFLKTGLSSLHRNARALSGVSSEIEVPYSRERTYYEYFNNKAFDGAGRTRDAVASRDACETRCNKAAWCSAFRFEKAGGSCSLYDDAPEYFSRAGTFSGAKIQDY